MPAEETLLTQEEKEILSAPPTAETPDTQQLDARDRSILAALDEMLAKNNNPPAPPKAQEESGIERFCIGMVRKGAGIISLCLILIFMGVVVICCFFSPQPDYLLPLKLSPVAAILMGLELLAYYLVSRRRFRINIPAIVISAVLVAGCCALAAALNNSYNESTAEYSSRTVAAQIYEKGYHELRHVADIEEIEVEVDLNAGGAARKSGIDALSADDVVIITVTFSGSYTDPDDFAAECKAVMDGYRFLGVPVTDFHFISDTRLHSFMLDVEGLFMQDYSEAQLAEKVRHIYIEDMDYIADLEDFVPEETVEATGF